MGRGRGLTLIELLVVLAIIATLLTIAVPRYFTHVERAKEATLRESLNVVRESIDKFHADTGRFPDELDELVTKRYLRKVPVDPVTGSAESWVIVPVPNAAIAGKVYDIKSGAPGNGLDGTPYAEW
jgi:general secretion pathway protein G